MPLVPPGLLVLFGLFLLAVAILLTIELTVVRRPRPLIQRQPELRGQARLPGQGLSG